MKRQIRQLPAMVSLTTLLAALAAFTATSQAQVTYQQITSGLVDYYPLNQVDTNSGTTYDLVGRRDMTLHNMTGANLVSDTHPGIESNVGPYVFNFTQSGGPTVITYQTTGQNPADGSGDFLPFINQRGAAMNFWIKGNVPSAQDLRVYGECANNGDSGSFFSLSSQPATKLGLGFFLRLNGQSTDPYGNTVNQMPDGSYETPSFFYVDSQSSQYTTNTLFNGNWHMFTLNVETNGDVHCFVDGIYDAGGTPANDNEGNPSLAPPMAVTNTYYNTTNTYPVAGPYFGLTNGQNPGFYVHWMVPGDAVAGAFSCIGGYDRNGGIVAGPVCELSDFGFWNRTLTTNEIQFVMTNGMGVCDEFYCSLCQPWPTSFSANPTTVHPGESVTLQWHIQAALTKPIISLLLSPAIGEVTNVTDYATGNGSTNLPVFTNTSFSLSLTYLNSCGYPEKYNGPAFTAVTVVPLVFTAMSYLPSDPGNAGNPSFTVTWNSVSNHTYTVQCKFDLTDPTWTTVTSGLPSGGNSTSFTNYTLGSSGTAYYRVTWP